MKPALSCRPAALAWEAAFLELARTQLTDMASASNLSLTFSAERSIRDEIDRETYTDMGTVALSYIVMLLYIACALGTLPHRPSWRDVVVHSRAALGLGGVLIVAASVVGALGLCSALGLWSALINLEVRACSACRLCCTPPVAVAGADCRVQDLDWSPGDPGIPLHRGEAVCHVSSCTVCMCLRSSSFRWQCDIRLCPLGACWCASLPCHRPCTHPCR